MPHSVEDTMEDVEVPEAPVEEKEKVEDVDMEEAAGSEEVEKEGSTEKAEEVKLETKESVKDIFKDEDFMDDDDMDEDFASLPMDASDPGVVLAFYTRLFPFRYLFEWLNHSPKPQKDFMHREFAFTLHNGGYIRYQAFNTWEDMRKDVLSKNPSRFEIGPVYNANPRDNKLLKKVFKPVEKELVFDIDLTDYDDLRTCCDKICEKCWGFIVMAIKVIDVALREDFGFKHILWVYSGRRGAHAWVSDKKARLLDDQKRSAILGYLEVIKGSKSQLKKVNLWRPLHPHLSRSFDTLRGYFEDKILVEQDPWRTQPKAEELLKLLPDKELNDALKRKWESQHERSSKDKWADIDDLAKKGVSTNLTKNTNNIKSSLKDHKQDIILQSTYPRLDSAVSKKLNHLLKSPFVIHPGTGRVCVPIDPSKVEDFNPLTVPTVSELLREIDEWDKKKKSEPGEEGERIADWEKTSLKPYVDYFRNHIAAILRDEQKSIKREREEEAPVKMEF